MNITNNNEICHLLIYIADIWKASIDKNATTWQGAKNGTIEWVSTHSKYLQPVGHQKRDNAR